MKHSRRMYWLFGALILLLGLGWIYNSRLGNQAAAQAPAVAQKGFTAPDFELQTLDGNKVRLSSLKGHAVVVNLWASWCGPCQEEMPDLQTVYAEYKAKGVEVLAVNMTLQDSPLSAAKFATAHQLTFPILLDTDGGVQRSYRVQALPTSFFIGADGVICDQIIGGPIPAALFRSELDDLLKAKP